MVSGRQGLYLEAWKFGVYISIPIFASVYYSDPETQKYWADYWQFIKYPENPNTNVREKIQDLVKDKERMAAQREAYKQQLQSLQQSANRTQEFARNEEAAAAAAAGDSSSSQKSWWRRAGGWLVRSKKND